MLKKYKPEYFATLLLPAGITSEAMRMDNRMYSEHAYQSDPEGDEPSADITLDEVGLCKGQKFALHYDFGDDWMFTITVSKISEVQEDFEPCVIKSKGTIQQYPDWDEDDFDEE